LCYTQPYNLIPNNGAEKVDLTVLPDGFRTLNGCMDWFQPNYGTSDFWHHEMLKNPIWMGKVPYSIDFAKRNIIPFKGEACFGLYLYKYYTPKHLKTVGANIYKEYLSVKLSNKLIANKNYHVGVYVRLSNEHFSNAYLSSFGFHFGSDSVFYEKMDNIPLIPQVKNDSANYIFDTLNWQKIDGIYSAKGGESYLIIGNFDSFENSKVKIDFHKMEERLYKSKITYNDLKNNNYDLRSYWFLDEAFLYEVRGDIECYVDSMHMIKETNKRNRDSINSVYHKFIAPLNFNNINRNESVALKNIAFDGNSSVIMFSSYDELDRLSAFLRLNLNINLILNVYSDGKGSEKESKKLSIERGQSIADYFKLNSVNPKRIKINGHSGLNNLVKNPIFNDQPKNYSVEVMFE
jgi:outer membrane protein OmpA-like peptidoglycan-associated protein